MEFADGNKLKGYIKNEANAHKINSNYAFNYFFARYFLEQLSRETDGKSYVLAGSTSQFCNIKGLFRPITDIDIICFENTNDLGEKIEGVIGSPNAVMFTIKNKFITPNQTTNYRIMCKFDKIEHLIKIDLKEDKISDNLVENDVPLYFKKDKPFKMSTISLEEHMSNKLYIILLNLFLYKTENKSFRRFKDFYDVYNILESGPIDDKKTFELLEKKISEDKILQGYSFNDKLIEPNFVFDNQKNWDEEKLRLQFLSNVSFSDTVDVYRGLLKK